MVTAHKIEPLSFTRYLPETSVRSEPPASTDDLKGLKRFTPEGDPPRDAEEGVRKAIKKGSVKNKPLFLFLEREKHQKSNFDLNNRNEDTVFLPFREIGGV